MKLLKLKKIGILGFFILLQNLVSAQGFGSGLNTSSILPITVTGVNISNGGNNSCTVVGTSALANSTITGSTVGNTAFGWNAINGNISGTGLTGIGYNALRFHTLGNNNTSIGYESGLGVSGSGVIPGDNNTGVGFRALQLNDGGYRNTAIGSQALASNKNSKDNVAVGYNSMLNFIGTASKAGGNTGLGYGTLSGLTTGITNVAIGYDALSGMTSGSDNIGIGYLTTLQNGIDHQLSIQNVIYGKNMDAAYNSTLGRGNIGITVIPAPVSPSGRYSKLHVGGVISTEPSLQLDVVPAAANVGNQFLFLDAEGIVSQAKSSGINLCSVTGKVPRVDYSGNYNLECSQIYDNNISVAIGNVFNSSSNFTYSTGTGQWLFGAAGGTVTPSTGTLRLAVDGVTQALSYYAYSDRRYKKDIRPVKNAIEIIKKLNGVTYKWDKSSKSDKVFNDIPQVGFIAQDVEKVVPEAIIKDKEGFYSMNYFTIIPILNEGIKEQQSQIENQKIKIADLENKLVDLSFKVSQLVPGNVIVSDDHFQIVPNPVTGTSIVSYRLDASVSNAVFIVYDLQGKMLKKYSVSTNTKEGQVQLSKTDFTNGMYILSLVSNNSEIQSKRFIISK